jgi:Mg-chelatase subunit ChlD
MNMRRLNVLTVVTAVVFFAAGPAGIGTAQETDGGAEIVLENQVTDGEAVTVASADLPATGHIGIVDSHGFLIGVSDSLAAGEHSEIEVTLDNPLNEDAELNTGLKAVLLTAEDEGQEYNGSTDPHERLLLDDDGQPISDTAIVTVENQGTLEPADAGRANFQIRSVNASGGDQPEPATITADIENVGNATGTQNISYTLEGENITTGTGAVDIVFALDQSGSMDDDNAVVRQELQNFTNRLQAENVDVRYAVVEMERPTSVVQNFTSNVSETRAAVDQILQSGGDTEDNFEALNRSLTLFSERSRPNAQQIIIDITDEGSNVDEPTQEELAERFNQTNTTYIAVTPPGDQDPMARYSPSLQKRPLANMTERGVWYNLVAGDFGEQFTEEIAQGVVDISRENQQELTLDPNETATVTLEVNTTTVPSGTYNVTVATANDTASTTLPIGTP